MARNVRTFFRELPRDTHDALAEAGRRNWKSTTSWRKLKGEDVTVVTPIATIRRIARGYTKWTGIPIVVSARPFKDADYAHCDGLAMPVSQNGRCIVYLHPVLQYYDIGYVKDLIGHEMDHCQVMMRRKS
jgi:hypothetical protein